MPAKQRRLRILLARYPEHQGPLDHLERNIQNKFDEMGRTIDLRRHQRVGRSQALLMNGGQGTRTMGVIKETIESINVVERKRLQQQAERVDDAARRAPWIYFGLVLAGGPALLRVLATTSSAGRSPAAAAGGGGAARRRRCSIIRSSKHQAAEHPAQGRVGPVHVRQPPLLRDRGRPSG